MYLSYSKLLCCFVFTILLDHLFPPQITAADITLDELLSHARKQNPVLRLARMDVNVASEAIRQSDALLYPRIDAQAGYTVQLEAQAMKANNQIIETQQPNYLFGNLSINYTLYDFGRRDARRTISRTGMDAAKLDILQLEQDVSLQVIENYYAILEAQKINSALTEELQTVNEHLRIATALYDAGSATRNDLLQAEVRLANNRQQLLTWRNKLDTLYLRLNFLTGLPSSDRPVLRETSLSVPRLQMSVQQRPGLLALRKGVEIKDQELLESRAAFYPEFFTRLSLDYLENDKLREQAIYSGGIGLKINLFDGFASTAVRSKAVVLQSRSREQLRLAEEQAQLEAATASNDLQVAFERITVTKTAIQQGEENLRINQNRYQERVGTASEMLDAQTLLTQAKTEHFRAQYDYQRAIARLLRATGNL